MKRHTQSKAEFSTPDMTPMLDIMFIILIFFMATASFSQMSGVEWSNADKSTTNLEQSVKPLTVVIDVHDSIWIDERLVDIENLSSRVAEQLKQRDMTEVILVSNANASSGVMVQAVEQMKLLGVTPAVMISEN